MDYENSKNPFKERRGQISKWRQYAIDDVIENEEALDAANHIREYGIKKIDSLHIASAVYAGAGYFLTTDDGILKKATLVRGMHITDPIWFNLVH